MAQGLTNTGIAKRVQLSERTVETHVRHVLEKLDLPDSEDGHRRGGTAADRRAPLRSGRHSVGHDGGPAAPCCTSKPSRTSSPAR